MLIATVSKYVDRVFVRHIAYIWRGSPSELRYMCEQEQGQEQQPVTIDRGIIESVQGITLFPVLLPFIIYTVLTKKGLVLRCARRDKDGMWHTETLADNIKEVGSPLQTSSSIHLAYYRQPRNNDPQSAQEAQETNTGLFHSTWTTHDQWFTEWVGIGGGSISLSEGLTGRISISYWYEGPRVAQYVGKGHWKIESLDPSAHQDWGQGPTG